MSGIPEIVMWKKFWELLDILLNTVLFVTYWNGFLVLLLKLNYFNTGLIAIRLVWHVRYLSSFNSPLISLKKIELVPIPTLLWTSGGLGVVFPCPLAFGITA